MANYQVFGHLVLADINGDRGTTTLPLGVKADTTTLATLATAIDLTPWNTPGTISNAKVVRAGLSVELVHAHIGDGSSPPLYAPYAPVTEKAVLEFSSSTGQTCRVSIPAPIAAAFLAPPANQVVDAAQTDVAAFITAMESALHDRGGNAFNQFKGGIRRGTRSRSIKTEYLTGVTP